MKNSFWKDGMSVKETKFSVVGLLTVIAFLFTLVYLCIYHTIAPELVNILDSLLLAFVGMNVVDTVSDAFGNPTTTVEENEQQGGNENEF